MIRFRLIVSFVFLSLVIYSCDGLKFPGKIFETSERAKYERSFSGSDLLMAKWKADFSAAVHNGLQIADGYAVTVNSQNDSTSALGYSLKLKKGDLLILESNSTSLQEKIFVDVFQDTLGLASSKSAVLLNGKFSKIIETDGDYKIVIQPEIGLQHLSFLKIYTQPSLAFPVAGKGNAAIQSFWGASRDAGARNHEGLDIFASRGTPALAATQGVIIRTGNEGLGGKQVWLRDEISGYALYYAHLDSILVSAGQKVSTGDTLGLVGNTGNAKGGATHLHFGIYTGKGAVDAYPFIRERKVTQQYTGDLPSFKTLKSGSVLRRGPGVDFQMIKSEKNEIQLKIIAGNGEWYHIKTGNGTEAFVNRSRMKDE